MARPSPVRDALAELLASADRHDWSMEDLHGALLERGIDADFSTVFRAVGRLEADGAIRRVELGDGRARFETAGAHHDHVRCDACGTVGEIPGCVVDAAVPQVQELTGFRVTGHQLLFSGLCRACAKG